MTSEQLYQSAVQYAITIEDGEIMPLVTITSGSDMVTWQGEKILIFTVNYHPELYIEGESIALPGEVTVEYTESIDEFIEWLSLAA